MATNVAEKLTLWAIFFYLAILAVGLPYRLIMARDDFDLINFLAYSFMAILLLGISKWSSEILNKRAKKKTKSDSEIMFRITPPQKAVMGYMGALIGISLPVLKGLPLVAVLVPPFMALMGFKPLYDEFMIDFLNLDFLTTTTSRLAFFLSWFLLGSAVVHLEFLIFWRYWDKVMAYSCASK